MADSSPQLSLAVGDRVVYPNQGVCRVSGVEAKEVAGQHLTFVTMKREEDGAVVMVPQAKVQTIGLRKVATADEVGSVFAFLKSDSDKADLDWKQRARTNLSRMAQGGLLGMAEVVKGLQVLSELRPLPNKERELYDSARHLLVAEIAVSLGISECDAEDSVDLILFPVGKERPKRTADEFKPAGDDGEESLELSDDLGLDGPDLELPPEEPEAGAEEPSEAEAPEGPATEKSALPSPPGARVQKKGGRAPKAKPAPSPARPAKLAKPAKAQGKSPKAKPKAAKDKPKDTKKKKNKK